MKINFSNVLYILIVSSVIGLLINFLRKDGIPLLKENRQLTWADSLKLGNNKDNDTINANLKKSAAEDSAVIMKENIGRSRETSQEELKEPKAINLKQAYKLYNNNIIFIDARDNADYKEGHIKNAINLPYYDFNSYKQVLKKIHTSSVIVTYCAGTDCDLSILLGKELFESGYKKVYIFFGGWNDWVNANYPTEKNLNL